MKTKFTPVFLLLCILNLTFISCEKDNDNPETPIVTTSKGVYIVNEGTWGSGNSSISFLNLENNSLTNNLYSSVNGLPLGDVAQSMTIHQGKGYIVVNNSLKIEVVDINDFSSISTITGFSSPRHMTPSASKGYVCDWLSNEVAVVDLNSGAIIKHIPVGNGPEQSTISGTKLFVANIGGIGSDSTVSVIDLFTDSVVATLQVGINPNSIVSDKYGKVWVLCGGSLGPDWAGGTADDVAGSIWCINPNTYVIEKQANMNSADHPVKLVIYKEKSELAYLVGTDGLTGKIVKMPISANTPNNTPIINNKSFYGLGINQSNNDIYAGYSPGFTQTGTLFRYTSIGVLIDSMEVGVVPNGFVFQ